MKRANRRILMINVLMLAAIMLLGCASSVEHHEEKRIQSLQPEKQLLQTHWETYLASAEELYSHLHWAFDYAEAFTRENSWESLLKARAACTAARDGIQQLALPIYSLTSVQYDALMDAGIEADVVRMEYEAFAGEQTLALNTLDALDAYLNNDIFMKASVDIIPDWIACNRGVITDISEYLCLTTNYLLLQLDSDTLWQEVEERYPHIGAMCTPWSEDPDQIMMNATAALDRYAERFVDMEEFTGVSEYTMQIVREAVETGNLDRLEAQMHTISGVPAYFLTPSWMTQMDVCSYLITDSDTQEKRLIQSGEKITEVPSGCYISCEAVAMESVEAYADTLESWGMEPYCTENADAVQLFVTSGESSLLVEWTEEETIVYLSAPVGCLIPELYLTAMRQENT